MPDTNILQFPTRASSNQGTDPADILLAKITTALRAMKDLHAELDHLKAMLKAQNSEPSDT